MRLVKHYFVVLTLATLACNAYGQEESGHVISAPTTKQNSLTIGELERIQEETLLYEFRAARAKAIVSWQQNGNGLDAPLPVRSQGQSTTASLDTGTTVSEERLPRILEISGSGKVLKSRMVMSDGTIVEVATGQRLPGSVYTVTQITGRSVQLKSDDGRLHAPAFSE